MRLILSGEKQTDKEIKNMILHSNSCHEMGIGFKGSHFRKR